MSENNVKKSLEGKVKNIGKNMGKAKAKQWVKKYQKANPDAELNGSLYGKDILEKLCNYPGSEGLWIFKGLDDNDEECFVLFPADAGGNILDGKRIKSLGAAASKNGDLDDPADNGEKCPPICPGGLG
ncbi:hypothetical protein [Ekhidna sp.]|uniref:hypothetical protein n=1 Tax=Ekhidna sp. TaxID=2608089 RepID=UPI003299F477